MKSIALVCGEFHRKSVEMVEYAKKEAESLRIQISDVVWVLGPMKSRLPVPDCYQRRIS